MKNLPADNSPPHAVVNLRLAEILAATRAVPAWRDDWLRLGPDSTEEERLEVYQAIRRSGLLPEEAGFYLVVWQADALASLRAETELREFDERLEAIETAYGRDEDLQWPSGEAPAEYNEVLQRSHHAWDALFVRTLREAGEHEMAQLFETDRRRFEEISQAGQEYFHGPAELVWLEELISAVAGCMETDAPMGPLGVRYRKEDGFWEIIVYPTPVELIGGAADGAVVDPGFSLDLLELQSLFDEVTDLSWSAHAFGDEPPYVCIEGAYAGKEVYLQVLAAAPEDEGPGMKLRLSG